MARADTELSVSTCVCKLALASRAIVVGRLEHRRQSFPSNDIELVLQQYQWQSIHRRFFLVFTEERELVPDTWFIPLTYLVLGPDVLQRLLGLGAERAIRLGVHHHAVLAHHFIYGAERQASRTRAAGQRGVAEQLTL